MRCKRSLVLLCALVPVLGCETAVRTERADPQQVERDLTRNVLSSGRLSAPSEQVLNRLGLRGRFASEPEVVLAELHAELLRTRDWNLLYVLAELSFERAQQIGDRPLYLTASAYAYAFLFPGDADLPEALDPRTRVAADLYNRALTWGLMARSDEAVVIQPREFVLPIGHLAITTRPADFDWGGYRFVEFFPLADVEVEGLRNRYRRRGIGAPLAASIEPSVRGSGSDPAYRRLPPDVKVPVTAFLRFEKPRQQLLTGELAATLELYTEEDTARIVVNGADLPLEAESSSSLAFNLESARLGEGEFEGFFIGDIRVFGNLRDGLLMLSPYRPGRIPVVLVHGTASSPAWWAEMLNELSNDPLLRDHYQFWLFRYNTGSPILYSASRLRKSLERAVADFDPQGRDPALRRMVVVGHSQGGLLTKLTVVDSGNAFWEMVSDRPMEELDLDPETRAELKSALFVKPVPTVKRVVFISTPHRGSYLATQQIASVISWIVRLPVALVTLPVRILQRNPKARIGRELGEQTSSIDDMMPGNEFLEILEGLPIAPGVSAHSIIAVKGDGPVEQGDDGVVDYQSARLEGVESELVVRSGHSSQTQPATIQEVDRILREHLDAGSGRKAASESGRE